MAFGEHGVDWMFLAMEWGTDLEVFVVWYYDVDMARNENLTKEEMDL
jgi:hypothetical protein